jgi:hypothetical protein
VPADRRWADDPKEDDEATLPLDEGLDSDGEQSDPGILPGRVSRTDEDDADFDFPSEGVNSPAAWYLNDGGPNQLGPLSDDEVKQWIRSGRITPESLVWREGWNEWRPAADVFSELQRSSGRAKSVGSPPQTPRDSDSLAEILQTAATPTIQTARRRRKTASEIRARLTMILAGITVLLFVLLLFVLFRRSPDAKQEPKKSTTMLQPLTAIAMHASQHASNAASGKTGILS